MPGFLNSMSKYVGRQVRNAVVGEIRTTARRQARDAIHDTFYVYNGTAVSQALKHWRGDLQEIQGVIDVRTGTHPENKRRKVILVSVENDLARQRAEDFLRQKAPKVGRLVMVA